MLFIISMPLWLGIPIWIISALVKANARGSGPQMISRTVTAPDGRRSTFLISADEPASVTIARMYPPGEGPPPPPPGEDFVNPIGRGMQDADQIRSALAKDRQYQLARVPPPGRSTSPGFVPVVLVLLGIGAVLVAIAVFTPNPKNDESHGVHYLPPIASTSPSSSPSVEAPSATLVPLLRIKTKSNIRSGPGTSYPVVRTADAGDKVSSIDRSNGWINIGSGHWIAASQVE